MLHNFYQTLNFLTEIQSFCLNIYLKNIKNKLFETSAYVSTIFLKGARVNIICLI